MFQDYIEVMVDDLSEVMMELTVVEEVKELGGYEVTSAID